MSQPSGKRGSDPRLARCGCCQALLTRKYVPNPGVDPPYLTLSTDPAAHPGPRVFTRTLVGGVMLPSCDLWCARKLRDQMRAERRRASA